MDYWEKPKGNKIVLKTVVWGQSCISRCFWLCIGSAAPCVVHCSCIIHVLCEFCFLHICVVDFFFPLCACLHKLYILPILYVSICTCVWLCTRAQAPRSLFADGREGGREGWMASHLRRVGVKLRAPNYSPGSCSPPSAPVFGCIFPDRVRWCAPLVSEVLVSGGPHLSTKHGCVWLADLNEIPS